MNSEWGNFEIVNEQIDNDWPELLNAEFDQDDDWIQPYDDLEENDENNSINLFWLQPYETDYLGWTEYDYYDSETIILKINKLKNEIFYTKR